MKTEASLQNKIKKFMELHGCFCAHLSPPNHPGFPDLIVTKASRVTYVEVKDFDQIGENRKFSALFQDAQPAFYAKSLVTGCPVWVVGYRNQIIWGILMDSQVKVDRMFSLGRDDYMHLYAHVVPSLSVLLP